MARFHVSADGKARACNASKGNCPLKIDDGDGGPAHGEFNSPLEAQTWAEEINLKRAGGNSFGSISKPKEVQISSPKQTLSSAIATAEQEYAQAENKDLWAENKLNQLVAAHAALHATIPGTPARTEAYEARTKARLDSTAADIVAWKASPFYNENVEEKMRSKAEIVNEADQAFESALANPAKLSAVAAANQVSPKDVEGLLEMVHSDYLRPRGGLATKVSELGNNELYVTNAAHIFRLETGSVAKILQDSLS